MSQEADETVVDTIKYSITEYALETFERAFPYFKDGLKPIHRRILFTMIEDKIFNFRKVAKVVGNVMGNYHPHGDSSIYEALVRMAQPFAMNYPYIDGQGNFGSQAGDGAAAARYIECKLSQFTKDVIAQDLDDVSVDYVDNYDYTRKMPRYLPSRVPLLLVNGMTGIAEAFTVDIPTHNLSDVVLMCNRYISNKSITNTDLVDGIFPDYPTGGEIINGEEVVNFYKNGVKCTIKLRANMEIVRDQSLIIIHDLPYEKDFDVIKQQVVEEISVKNNVVLQGVMDMQENNNRLHNGRITYDVYCKKEANLIEIMNELYNVSNLSSSECLSFMMNYGNKVKYINVKIIIEEWYNTRVDYKRRKYTNEIAQLQNKKHIYEGIASIYGRVDELITAIKNHIGTREELIQKLHKMFKFTVVQANSICNMSLSSISQTSKLDLTTKIESVRKNIDELEENLINIDNIIIAELKEIEEKYKRPRQTKIHMNLDTTSKIVLSISRGSFITTRNAIGLFDANGIRESKTLINGMRPIKIDGKNVREMCTSISIKDGIKGFIIFYEDGTVNKISISDIRVLNSWYEITDDKNFISCATPYYNDTDCIVCVSKDAKIKQISVNEIQGKRAVGVGDVIKSCLCVETVDCNVLLCNSIGEYCNMQSADIPLLGRSASGVKTNFDSNYKVFTTVMKNNCDTLLVCTTDTKDNQSYIVSVPIEDIDEVKRTNKYKKIITPNDHVINSINFISTQNKDSNIVCIGASSSTTLKVINFKKKYDFRRTFIPIIGSVQI